MTLKTLVWATNKGGDGKTKGSILLTEYLGKIHGLNGLVIDLDPQCNCSSRFLKMEIDPASKDGKIPPLHPDYNKDDPADLDWSGRSTIANIFYGEAVIPYPTHISGIDIAPGHGSRLLEAEAVTRSEVADKVYKQLKKFLNLPEVCSLYDFCIIDTPPSKGPLTISAFKAATHLLIPSQMEEYSIQGIYGMLQLWKQESYSRGLDDPIKLVGILPNRLRDINLHRDFLEHLRATPGISDYILPCALKERAIYAEVDVESASPRTVFDLPKKHIGRQEALRVCEFIYRSVFAHVEA